MASYPTLHYGQSNLAVRSLQHSLRRALIKKGIAPTNKANGVYGPQTRADVNRFKSAFDISPVQGKDFGGDGEWVALEPFIGEYDRTFIDAYTAKVKAEREAERQKAAAAAKAVGAQTKLVAAALRLYADRAHYVYRQVRPMPDSAFTPEAYNRLDCSSTVTLLYKAAGLPDPNGRDYDGQGYTGTLWPRGEAVTGTPQAGDLAFYGTQDGGIPSHVAICISPTEVVSFGHTPIERYPIRYRSDFRGVRRYI